MAKRTQRRVRGGEIKGEDLPMASTNLRRRKAVQCMRAHASIATAVKEKKEKWYKNDVKWCKNDQKWLKNDKITSKSIKITSKSRYNTHKNTQQKYNKKHSIVSINLFNLSSFRTWLLIGLIVIDTPLHVTFILFTGNRHQMRTHKLKRISQI